MGQEIPKLVVTVDPVQMFYFSAATYNGHRIHYDRKWTTEEEGYPDIVVQGPLQAALLARAVTDWIGGAGWLVRYAVQNRGSAFAGEELALRRRGDRQAGGGRPLPGRPGDPGDQGRRPGADAGNRHGQAARGGVTRHEAER